MSHRLGLFNSLQCAIIGFSTCSFFLNNIFSFGSIYGNSMDPTLSPNNVVIAKILNYKLNKGDVVVVYDPEVPNSIVIKRLIAIEGDKVIVKKKHYDGSTESKKITIPSGHIWLEGDNSNSSYDSRFYGSVPASLLLGKAVFCIWPLKNIGFVKSKPKNKENKMDNKEARINIDNENSDNDNNTIKE